MPDARDEPITPVLFRADRSKDFRCGVTAVFPCEPADYSGNSMSCYVIVGQHGGCDYGWYNRTHAATPAEYAEIKAELEAQPYGYRFKVYSRMQPWMRRELQAEARRLRNRPVAESNAA